MDLSNEYILMFIQAITACATLGVFLQIQQSSRAFQISIRRDAMKYTSDMLKTFRTEIIPKMEDFDSKSKYFKVSPTLSEDVKATLRNFTLQEIESLGTKSTLNEFYFSSITEATKNNIESFTEYKDAIYILNALEDLAMPLVQGVGSEEIAFNPLSGTFCNAVARMYVPLIHMKNFQKDPKLFTNTVKLYNVWNDRIQKELLKYKKLEISGLLEKRTEKTIKPFGL